MKISATILALLAIFIGGCNGVGVQKELLTVDFQEGQTLRYKFVSSRDIFTNWGVSGKSKSGKGRIDKSSESVTMIVAYHPVSVDPYGLTTIKATCESVKTKHVSKKAKRASKRDAVESLAGKSFTFTVNALGKMQDTAQLEELIKEAGEKAFRSGRKGGRIKEPDTISDFTATQWFLWNPVSSIDQQQAIDGIPVGQTWESVLSVPSSIVWSKARAVNYQLEEIRETEEARIAVISSSYSFSESVPSNAPLPYSGSFRMSGMFGFLSGYKVLKLQGHGTELFNIDLGRTEEYEQSYTVETEASFPMAIGADPVITIEQKITMKLLKD